MTIPTRCEALYEGLVFVDGKWHIVHTQTIDHKYYQSLSPEDRAKGKHAFFDLDGNMIAYHDVPVYPFQERK